MTAFGRELPVSISMHQTSVVALGRALNNLAAILEKAAAHAEAKKIEPAILLNSRLFPDMFPLVRQVQLATDTARIGTARIAGVEFSTFEDNETTFAQLVTRIHTTLAQLQSIKPEQLAGREDVTVTWQSRTSTKSMQGLAYLLNHVVPNVYFHVTTAYNILRHNGVEIGKKDFLGNP
jgi:hypothetical protein